MKKILFLGKLSEALGNLLKMQSFQSNPKDVFPSFGIFSNNKRLFWGGGGAWSVLTILGFQLPCSIFTFHFYVKLEPI